MRVVISEFMEPAAVASLAARFDTACDADLGERRDQLKRLIAESHAGGQIDPGEAGMLTGVFHLHEQEARQVMTPIPAVVKIDVSQDVIIQDDMDCGTQMGIWLSEPTVMSSNTWFAPLIVG